jgi:hypothetical protein
MTLSSYYSVLSIVISTGLSAYSQQIPAHRITNWDSPGAKQIFTIHQRVEITTFGADRSGLMACDQALQMALKDLNGPGEIFFPAGTYLFKQTIHLPDSILLRGEMDSSSLKPLSILMLAPGNNRHGISITGGQALVIDKIHYELKQGSQKLAVRSPSSFIPGDIIKLNPTDDSTLVNNTWAFESTGQIFEILKIEGDSLILNKPLRRSYSGTHAPLLKKSYTTGSFAMLRHFSH